MKVSASDTTLSTVSLSVNNTKCPIIHTFDRSFIHSDTHFNGVPLRQYAVYRNETSQKTYTDNDLLLALNSTHVTRRYALQERPIIHCVRELMIYSKYTRVYGSVPLYTLLAFLRCCWKLWSEVTIKHIMCVLLFYTRFTGCGLEPHTELVLYEPLDHTLVLVNRVQNS